MKTIRKLISFLLITLCLSSSVFAFENANVSDSGLRKFYVQSCDVKVANDGIFVNYQGDTLIVSSIHVDAEGTY